MAIETVELSHLNLSTDSSCGSPALKRGSAVEHHTQSPKRPRIHLCGEKEPSLCTTGFQTWGWDGAAMDKLSLRCDSDEAPCNRNESPPRRGSAVAGARATPPCPGRPAPARDLTWYPGAELLEHLLRSAEDSRSLTEMLRDSFLHSIGRLAQHHPAYHPKMGYIDLVDPRCQYAVVRRDGIPVAAATIHHRYAGLAGFALVTHLMVRRDVRGQGLGSFLLDAIHSRAKSAGDMVGLLLPTTLPADQMLLTLPRCLGWLCQQGYRLQDWGTTANPFTACTLLQLTLDGLPFRDHYFLFRAPEGDPGAVVWQGSIDDGSLLQQLRVLKMRVLGRCRDGLQRHQSDAGEAPDDEEQ